MYLNFYGVPGHTLGILYHSGPQQYFAPVAGEGVSRTSYLSPSAYLPRQGQIQEPVHMDVEVGEDEGKQTEATVMYEGGGAEQIPPLQNPGVLARGTTI